MIKIDKLIEELDEIIKKLNNFCDNYKEDLTGDVLDIIKLTRIKLEEKKDILEIAKLLSMLKNNDNKINND